MTDALVKVFLVGVGGGLGSISRFGLSEMAQQLLGPGSAQRYPLGTLMANVLGCLLAGFLAFFLIDRSVLTPQHRLLLMTGFLGGLTTFSSFGYETVVLSKSGDWGIAGLNIVANVVLSLAAVWAGWAAARAIWG